MELRGLGCRAFHETQAVTLRKALTVRSLSLRLGLVSGLLCGPSLALAPVQAPSQRLAPRFSSSAIPRLRHIGAVEQLVGLVATGFAQVIFVDLLDHRVLMAAAVRHALILLV